ncbi:hypothetical protein FHX37_4434 [Haloactinospora alba]|uniref:Uncharacterized protein n=1 Tax=Haloactinospora alba TaxID=405555 RepID=A0A543N7C3_9ACTN|nr:hypothetical protein FHX37_4434 [Haloactinospora alba]
MENQNQKDVPNLQIFIIGISLFTVGLIGTLLAPLFFG